MWHCGMRCVQSAGRHEAAAALWDARGESAWSAFERRCAGIERAHGRLEADQVRLYRLRACSPERRGAAHAEIDRLSAEIKRRAVQLKGDDAVLEQERIRLRREHAQGRWGQEQTWAWQMADERERTANRREEVADKRDLIADERDRIANHREADADQHERFADAHARVANEGKPERERERVNWREDRDAREEARMRREDAAAQRELAAHERRAERAMQGTRTSAGQLASTLLGAAEALERSADLAEDHARRQEEPGETALPQRSVARLLAVMTPQTRPVSRPNRWPNISAAQPTSAAH
jgi:hypothetical protein